MSADTFTMVPDWLMYRTDFTPVEKLCYGRMSRYCIEKGYGWASQQTIATQIGCEIRQVGRAMRRFAEEGLVKLKQPPRGSRFPVIFRVLTPANILSDYKRFLAKTETQASKLDRLGAELMADSVSSDKKSYEVGLKVVRDETSCLDSSDKKSRKDTREETTQETTEERNECRGSLRSPQVVSLRSATQTSNLTENQLLFTDEEFTNKNGFAATALRFEPVTVEAVTDETPEEAMSDEEREARKASWARAALMGAQRFDAAKAAKEAKQRAKAKQAASQAPGEPPKVKVPKQTLVGKLHDLQQTWMLEFQQKFPNDSMEKTWGPKEGGMLKRLLERWGHEDLERAMRYYIRYWEQQKVRYPKIKATLPSLGLFTSLDASVVPEAKKMFTALKAKSDYKQWCDANPSATSVPDDIQAAFDAVREDLKALGI